MEIVEKSEEASVPADDALSFLRSVYQCPALSLHVRMKAASLALPYESPKLAVTAVIEGKDFGTLLEERLKRINGKKAKAIEAPKIADLEL
jgi:hypothetical protein